jgi:thiamine biosynthesis protein ThiS
MITVNGKDRSWREGMTVTDLLRDLHDSHHYAVVRINDRRITRTHFEKTLIPDHSKIFLVPMIAGG